MYTAVLMMALTTGVDMPDGRRGGCHGCHGCYGGGCYGGGWGGGYGGGCCGCYGGGGGYGGCYGGGGYGGCYGGGGYGGCYGGGGFGGCMGMGYGGCSGMGYGGCYGGGAVISGGCSGGGYGLGGTIIMPGTGTGTSGETIKSKPKEKDGKETMLPAPATIVVELPADAKLTIDNEATTSTGNSRVFSSPALNPGKEYHYTLKAEIVRDGKPVKAEKVVAVKAGEITPVTLTLPPTGVAQR